MPFVSEKQRRLCWFLYAQDIKTGKTPTWDCHEWAHTSNIERPIQNKKYVLKYDKDKKQKKLKK